MNLLLVIAFILVSCYNSGCIQSKKYYEIELSDRQKAEIAEMTAKRILEAQK